MLHPLIIGLIALVFARDALGVRWESSDVERWFWGWWGLGVWGVAGAFAALHGAVVLAAHTSIRRCAARLDRTHSARWALRAQRRLVASRFWIFAAQAGAFFALDALGAVRAIVGDLVIVDEALAMAPPLAAMTAGWFSFYPVDRSLREAIIMRRLDEGGSIYTLPGRWRYTFDHLRHEALAALAPILFILAWHEWLSMSVAGDPKRWEWVFESRWGELGFSGLELAGAVVALAFAPLAVRVLWDTKRLGEGVLRARIGEACRDHGVRFGAVLVWRTHGTLLNAAVLGLLPPVRYLLLSDALLESLQEEEVEAVVAHELAHVRRRHLPWLVVAMVAWFGAPLALVSVGTGWLAEGLGAGDPASFVVQAIEGALVLAALFVGLMAFGMTSRRFEWQADAFAAQHLSGLTKRAGRGAGLVVSHEAAEAMAGALGRVAKLNCIPAHRFGFRHGSIAERQRRVRELVGLGVDRLPIDRAVGRMKAWSLVGLFVVIAATALELSRAAPEEAPAPSERLFVIVPEEAA